uniref:Uncharacterized protein n=1 Tax=Oryza barthii TaxID=65489 RepID=A0A0D3GWB7_9ORYZ
MRSIGRGRGMRSIDPSGEDERLIFLHFTPSLDPLRGKSVNVDSTAETLGIRRGDVIVFQDTDSCTSPQLENYLLSLGWGYLQGIRLTADLKVEVHNLMDSYRESITFPLQFSDASRRRIEVT